MYVSLHWATQSALVIIAIVNVVLLAVLVGAVFGIMKAVRKMQKQLQPLIDRTGPIMERVPALMDHVPPIMDRVPPIMDRVPEIMDRVPEIMDRVPPIMDEVRPAVANVTPLLNENVKPILNNVREVTGRVSRIVTDLGEHVHGIAETGGQTVQRLTRRVESTGQVVTETVSKPVIGAASLLAGVGRAFSVLKNYNKSASEGTPSHAEGNGREVAGSAAAPTGAARESHTNP